MTNQVKYNEIKNLCSDFYSEMDKLITRVFSDFKIENDDYINDLKKYLLGSSKQIRSCLIFLFAKNLGYMSEDMDIVKLATAVEIIHNATLIHDDIIDEAQIRRGEAALHHKYSNKLGVISGDFLLSVAFNLLLDLPNDVIKEFSSCLNLLCFGEIKQYFSQKRTPTFEQYFKKSEMKTSSLFIAGLVSLSKMKKIGSEEEIKLFAQHFGLAFQFRDDLKNIIDEDKSKPFLNDISQGIYTLPVIFAYGENKDLSNELPEKIIQKSKEMKNIEQSKKLIAKEIKFAINSLDKNPRNNYKFALIELINLLYL